MPKPNKGEAKQDFLKRCTSELISNEKRGADQAYKLCNLYWDDAIGQRAAMNMNLPVFLQAAADNDAPRRFEITAYTGKKMETFYGPVIFALNGMHAKEKIPILREHRRDRIIGFGRAHRDDRNYYVSGEFSKNTRDAKEVMALADEKFPWQASVSIRPLKIKTLADAKMKEEVNGRQITGPAEIWLESEVGEVSFVALGRDDDTAAISLHDENEKYKVEFVGNKNFKDNEVKQMEITMEILKKEAPELITEIENAAYEKGVKEGEKNGIKNERARIEEILDADADHIESRKAIKEGIEAAAAFKLFYNAEKRKRALGLKELESSAQPPLGTEEPLEQQPPAPKTELEMRREWRPVMGPAAV